MAKRARAKGKAAKKVAKAKPARKARPKAKAKAKPPMLPAGARAQKAIDAVVAHLTGENAPSADRRPLSDAEVTAFEQAAGAAMSPALFAVLTADAREVARNSELFDDKLRLQAKSFAEIVKERAEMAAQFFAPLYERFPGKAAVAADYPGEWFEIIYFGDPDGHGEYPVLHFYFRDEPEVTVSCPGTDVWLAYASGLATNDYPKECEAVARRLFGKPRWSAF
jgi:hypothetical protein